MIDGGLTWGVLAILGLVAFAGLTVIFIGAVALYSDTRRRGSDR